MAFSIRYETCHELKSEGKKRGRLVKKKKKKKRSILTLGALPVHCRSYGRKGGKEISNNKVVASKF